MSEDDQHNLQRFLLAQSEDYKVALAELQQGRKKSHWIWYVFPQVEGLGHSSRAQEYAIRSKGEAVAYLEHEILGSRLHECCEALLQHKRRKKRSRTYSELIERIQSARLLNANPFETLTCWIVT